MMPMQTATPFERRRRRSRRRLARRRVPRRRPAGDDRVPAVPARQAAAARRARPGWARPNWPTSAGARPPAGGCCGCSATRARTRPRPCTSGTTASSCSTPRSCARRSARSSPTPPTCSESVDRIAGRGQRLLLRALPRAPAVAARPSASPEPVVLLIDEVDRADEALEAVLLEIARRVPGLDPRDRHGRARSTSPTSSSPRTTPATCPPRSNAAACTCSSTTRMPTGSWRSSAARTPACRWRWPRSWSRSCAACASSTCARHRASPRPSTGPARSPSSGSPN